VTTMESPDGSDSKQTIKEYVLKEDNELRFEVAGEDVSVELCEGRAEIFGTELKKNEKYLFRKGTRTAVFSWVGATIELLGPAENVYVAENNHPMIMYLNTHAGLEQMRKKAAKEEDAAKARGPRVMVVGPTDVGKSSVCRLLNNYAVRMGRTPIFVDVDVGQGNIGIAGTIGAILIEKTADPVFGFDTSNAKIFQFGSASPGANIPLYDHLVSDLANLINRECNEEPSINKSGIIINTCGWVNGAGYKSIVNVAESFEVDVVVVLDHERLYTELKRDLPSFVKIVHHPKSGGVESRPQLIRANNRRTTIHKYFYGDRLTSYTPYRFEVDFDKLIVAKIGTAQVPESCLPYGTQTEDHRMMVVRVEPSPKLLNHVVAILPPEFTEVDQTLVNAVVIGFGVIIDVNVQQKTFIIMCPSPTLSERHIGLLSEITFVDDEAVIH